MQSQYTEQYLVENDARGVGNGLTPGSFLASTLRGNARRWIGRYEHSLIRSVLKIGAIANKSAHGKIAYYSR